MWGYKKIHWASTEDEFLIYQPCHFSHECSKTNFSLYMKKRIKEEKWIRKRRLEISSLHFSSHLIWFFFSLFFVLAKLRVCMIWFLHYFFSLEGSYSKSIQYFLNTHTCYELRTEWDVEWEIFFIVFSTQQTREVYTTFFRVYIHYVWKEKKLREKKQKK